MAEIEKIKKLRSTSLLFNKNVPLKELVNVGDCTIIGFKEWKGLKTRNGMTLLQPIYDDIKVIPNSNCCLLKLEEVFSLYDLGQGQMLEMDMPLINFKINEITSTITVETEKGKGLYSCRKHKLVVPAEFAEVTESDAIRYLWVRTHEGRLAFYDTVEGRLIKCPEEVEMCVESSDNIMWVKIGSTIKAINDGGLYDKSIMRRCALARRGRMRFYNYNYNESIITDVYGHIIN